MLLWRRFVVCAMCCGVPSPIFSIRHPQVLVDASKMSVMLMFIIFNALIFSHVLTELRIPQDLANLVISEDMRPWMFLIIVNVILLIVGSLWNRRGFC